MPGGTVYNVSSGYQPEEGTYANGQSIPDLFTAGIIFTLADGNGTISNRTGSEDERPNIWEPYLGSLFKLAQDVRPSAKNFATGLTEFRERYASLEHSQGIFSFLLV